MDKRCTIEGCDRKHYSRGWCHMHYQRAALLGSPGEATARFLHGDPVTRFWRFVDRRADGECWLWTGTITSGESGGYGAFSLREDGKRRMVRAHRYAYELLVGPIPDKLTLDHLCRVRRCVNPAHLEPVTHKENVLRGEGPTAQGARQTECKRGHDLTDPANLKPNSRGARQCRVCSNLARMDRYWRLGK